uniref:Uncharacterized protein n=1 Tax=Romanomermis culicivorax TaxID=13658 RepID=A0A915IC07_ROMCU
MQIDKLDHQRRIHLHRNGAPQKDQKVIISSSSIILLEVQLCAGLFFNTLVRKGNNGKGAKMAPRHTRKSTQRKSNFNENSDCEALLTGSQFIKISMMLKIDCTRE